MNIQQETVCSFFALKREKYEMDWMSVSQLTFFVQMVQ